MSSATTTKCLDRSSKRRRKRGIQQKNTNRVELIQSNYCQQTLSHRTVSLLVLILSSQTIPLSFIEYCSASQNLPTSNNHFGAYQRNPSSAFAGLCDSYNYNTANGTISSILIDSNETSVTDELEQQPILETKSGKNADILLERAVEENTRELDKKRLKLKIKKVRWKSKQQRDNSVASKIKEDNISKISDQKTKKQVSFSKAQTTAMRRIQSEWKDVIQAGIAFDWVTGKPQQQKLSKSRSKTKIKNNVDQQSSKTNLNGPSYIWLGPLSKQYWWVWHFSFVGIPGSVYENGVYHGRITINPKSYPSTPPSVQIITPSGRFIPATDICLSTASNYHPELWQPAAWTIRSIVEALRLHMISGANEIGGMNSSYDDKIQYAKDSRNFFLRLLLPSTSNKKRSIVVTIDHNLMIQNGWLTINLQSSSTDKQSTDDKVPTRVESVDITTEQTSAEESSPIPMKLDQNISNIQLDSDSYSSRNSISIKDEKEITMVERDEKEDNEIRDTERDVELGKLKHEKVKRTKKKKHTASRPKAKSFVIESTIDQKWVSKSRQEKIKQFAVTHKGHVKDRMSRQTQNEDSSRKSNSIKHKKHRGQEGDNMLGRGQLRHAQFFTTSEQIVTRKHNNVSKRLRMMGKIATYQVRYVVAITGIILFCFLFNFVQI